MVIKCKLQVDKGRRGNLLAQHLGRERARRRIDHLYPAALDHHHGEPMLGQPVGKQAEDAAAAEESLRIADLAPGEARLVAGEQPKIELGLA